MKHIFKSGAFFAVLMSSTVMTHADISRTDQSMRLLYEGVGVSGSYFELSYADVSPQANAEPATATAGFGGGAINLDDPLVDYTQLALGYKNQLSDDLSLVVIYDEPYGAETTYQGGLPFFGGSAAIGSDSLTAVAKYQIDEQISLHGGLRTLEASGEIYTGQSGLGSGLFGLLEAQSDMGLGFVLGGAYEIPEIALRASLTYSSGIDLSFEGTETAFNPSTGTAVAAAADTSFDVEFPSSLNLDFQTGVAPGTLVFASMRDVGYDGFNLTNDTGEYVKFSSDSTTYVLGVGRQFSETLAGSLSYTYRAAGSSPSDTALAPTTGLNAISLGARYTMDDLTISGGITLGTPGDQTVSSSVVDGGEISFKDNEVNALGLRIGYRF